MLINILLKKCIKQNVFHHRPLIDVIVCKSEKKAAEKPIYLFTTDFLLLLLLLLLLLFTFYIVSDISHTHVTCVVCLIWFGFRLIVASFDYTINKITVFGQSQPIKILFQKRYLNLSHIVFLLHFFSLSSVLTSTKEIAKSFEHK